MFALSTTEYSLGILEVFPNPSDGFVRIEVPIGLNNTDVEIVVLDSKGQTIIRTISSSQNFEMLNTGDWTNGVYQIILTVDGESYANRLIVN